MPGRQHKAYPIVIRDLEVLEAFDVTPSMRRVVVGGDQLGAFTSNGFDVHPFLTENADDHVKLVFLEPDGGIPVPVQQDGHLDWPPGSLLRARDYTPRRFDAATGRLELDFVRHEGGLAAGWAIAAIPGDRLLVAGPRGTTVVPDDVDWHFMVADETALPAVARRIEELPEGVRATAVVSVPSAADEQDLGDRPGLEVTWVHRDRSPGDEAFMTAVRAAAWHDGQVYAWAAGEAGMLRPVRRWFKDERGVDKGHTDVSGYWRAGQSQAEKAEALHELRHDADLALPHALRAAVTLQLVEHVEEGARDLPALAAAVGADPRGLLKLVRLLAAEGYLLLGATGTVGVTRRGALLTEETVREDLDHAQGLARLDDAWPGLLHAVRTGRPGYDAAVGESFWSTLSSDDALGESFDDGLAEWAEGWTPALADALPDVTHLVDVGGGNGAVLSGLLQARPALRGTLVDLPTTAARATKRFADDGVADRAEVVAQSFFEPLPGGVDAYLLAQVLHDWPDAEAELILGRVAEAAGPAPVLLVERLVDDDGDHHEAGSDLQMFTVFGGGERTVEEYASLAQRAGLALEAAAPLDDGLHVMVLRRA